MRFQFHFEFSSDLQKVSHISGGASNGLQTQRQGADKAIWITSDRMINSEELTPRFSKLKIDMIFADSFIFPSKFKKSFYILIGFLL